MKTTARVGKVAARLLFSTDEAAQIQQAARSVWNAIGYDCLQATAADGNKPIDRVTMKRDEVIEVVLDAGRVEEKLPEPLRTRVRDCDYAALIAVVKPAFPHARYGV